ncbi:MAG TPA: diacylglycerol kinase family protein [Blastocatellia bacterium]|nr:diacylglycerol kinase family protein [Blastocatellia bacterium]
MKTLFIINPVSGRGSALRTWAECREQLTRMSANIGTHLTTGPGDATEATRRALLGGYDQIVIVGGDGTLNEAVNGYLDKSGRPINPAARLAILPGGTGSDFRRSVGITSRSRAIQAILGDRAIRIDAGSIHHGNHNGESVSRFFLNVVSFGLGGAVSAFVNRWNGRVPRWVSGHAVFSAAALAGLKDFRSRSVTLTLDEDKEIRIQSNLLVVANGSFAGGGMMLAPNAKLDDGLFDVVMTHEATRFDVVRELSRIRSGGYIKNPKVSQIRTTGVRVGSNDPMAIDIDGESGGYSPAILRVIGNAILVAVPPE